MSGYTPTGPFDNGGAPGINAGFLNNVENCLVNAISDPAITNDGAGNLIFSTGNLKRAAGHTETGGYFIAFASTAASQVGSYYYASQSRGVTPLSVTVDSSQYPPTNCTAPGALQLTANGVQVFTNSSAAGTNNRVGGGVTIQY
jgi:hypothetical protein